MKPTFVRFFLNPMNQTGSVPDEQVCGRRKRLGKRQFEPVPFARNANRKELNDVEFSYENRIRGNAASRRR